MASLERFVKRLAQTLTERDPAGVHRPVTVAELRTTVLPYRAHRLPLGLTSSEDYELLVIRLVAEEGEYVRTNPPAAAELARTEAAHPNPNLDLVEDLADVTVQIGAAALAKIAALGDLAEPARPSGRIPALEFLVTEPPEPTPDRVPPAEPVSASAPPASAPASAPAGVAAAPPPLPEPARGEVSAPPPPKPEPAPPPPPKEPEPVFEPIAETIDVEPAAAESPAGPVNGCRSCHAALPDHRPVAFCPFCGTRQGPPTCRRCGSGIEPGWRHCVTCGYLVPPGAFA